MDTNSINTVAKGSAFEKRSIEILKRAIEEQSLGIGNNVIIREKPAYYSAIRKKDIVFDLSIEVWPPGAERFVLVYIVECKDYSSSIPVNDVEEFYVKVKQVADGYSKAVFIANNSFQEGAFNFAESTRMMLIRAGEGTDHSIILHKVNKKAIEIPFISKGFGEGIELLVKLIDKVIDSAFRSSESPLELVEEINLEFLAKEQITQITQQLLLEIHPKIKKTGVPLTTTVLENHIKGLGINLLTIPKSSEYLGNCDIRKMRIEINESLINTNRYLFVLAHELGHYMLHKDLRIDQQTYDSFPDPALNFRTNKYELKNPKHWIEWQANYFATSLILPHYVIKARLWFYQDQLNMREGKLYLTINHASNDLAIKIISKLANYFFVSKTMIIYRLKELDLLEEYSNTKSIGELINGVLDSFVE